LNVLTHKGRNAVLAHLEELLPAGCRVVIVANREFGQVGMIVPSTCMAGISAWVSKARISSIKRSACGFKLSPLAERHPRHSLCAASRFRVE